ncbi:MAG: motility associated factor glycosyltransferase family protein [Spirochaetaceae bacterium]|nr:motility associated factor glycosyltransferase family protein [Spirochaetaceae bacterium]
MNSNRALFEKRFPQLAEQYKPLFDSPVLPENVELLTGRNGQISATYMGLSLHSAYNPEREAQKLVSEEAAAKADAGVFLGFGLGYGAVAFAKEYTSKTLVLIECNPEWFLLALSAIDFTPVFEHQSLVLLVGAPQQTIISVLEKIGLQNCCFFKTKSHIAHNEQYFINLENLIERNRQKKEINDRTLEKFSMLWLKNMCRNLDIAGGLDGVARYFGAFAGMDACVIAAGPSLDDVLPYIKEIQKRTLIVCVDTALRACLNAGVQPDFIVIVDPQYWNIRHLDGLAAPESRIITELAVYPPVFRFPCKEKLLCSSIYPLGKYIEKQVKPRGELGAGGSVVTTAWDFARQCGCKRIFMAGLDLGFPERKTHFKGSTFEERSHRLSERLHPAETDSFNALYGAYPYEVSNYEGGKVLTDKRMALYAWWFESKCLEFPEVKTCTLCPKGVSIPGITPVSIEEVLKIKDISAEKAAVLGKPSKTDFAAQKAAFQKALQTAKDELYEMLKSAKKAQRICKDALENPGTNTLSINKKLSEIDSGLIHNKAAELASLVFPGEKQLEALTAKAQTPLEKSLIVYREIEKAVSIHLEYLQNA